MSNKIVDISGLERFFDNIKNYISGILSNKVDKVQGKDLSTEDFTTELKSKLSQVNILAEDAKTTIDDINKDTYIKYVVQSLTDTQKEQVRKNIGVNNKQDKLVSGTSIKTINGTSILGSGDITITADLSEYAKKTELSSVATSGSYNDLTNKPTIPSAVSESTVTNWGFTKNTGTVTGIKMNGSSKGTSGIIDLGTVITSHQDISGKQDVISDLATIRSNASKGATAVQPSTLATVATSGSYNDLTNKPTIPSAVTESTVTNWGFTKNAGTVTGIKMNGSSKGTSGIIDLGTVITSHQDISGKQDTLVSGNNIKTINGTSILGSGNIISGYKTVQHISESTISLSPNIYYIKDNSSSTLTITFNAAENNTIMNEYFIKFNTASSGTSVSLPNTIKWVDGQIPEFENDCTYQISVIDDLGVCVKFI